MSRLKSSLGRCVPPTLESVRIFFEQKGFTTKSANNFFRHYSSINWKTVRGFPVRNWKTTANSWIDKEAGTAISPYLNNDPSIRQIKK
ncbi:MAG TPA: hypothetical protein VL053_19900 [Arachidicoccus sp.]|nr:hypothetical protein [Arachidicoccus sp.]